VTERRPASPIEATADIGVAASDVWAVLVEPGHIVDVHPFCARNDVERWPGPDGRDHVHYFGGLHYRRDVLEWREGTGSDLALGPPGTGKIAIASWWLQPTGDDSCTLRIEVTSFLRDDVSPATRERYERTAIRGSLPHYLDSVVRGVAHFSETGTPVVRNQFGPHPTYSPAVT
jgi:hypothetical protein